LPSQTFFAVGFPLRLVTHLLGPSSLRMSRILTLLASATGVAAHGSLLWPLPRGGIDRVLPEYSDPDSWPVGHYDCRCTNATEPCISAQSCLWFENGCTIGEPLLWSSETCAARWSQAPWLARLWSAMVLQYEP
jgi:hypothetical protein